MSILGTLLGPIAGVFTSWNDGRNKLKAADLDIKLAEKQNKARLLRDEQSNNHGWEMASLADKDKWLRRISFAIFVWPMTPIGVWKPEWLIEYYKVLELVPEWQVQLIMIMVGGVWGVAELKNSLPAIVGAFKKK